MILIVENNDELCALAAEALESAGFEVQCAVSPSKALEQISGGLRPTCVILDMNMSAQGCQSLLDNVKETLRGIRCVLVLTSGRFDLPSLAQYGHTQWTLPKPYELDELVEVIRNATSPLILGGTQSG